MTAFFADSDLAGVGEFVEPEVLISTEFTIPDGTAFFRWRWPTVAPIVTPLVWVFDAANDEVIDPLPFDTSVLEAWNTAGAGSPVSLAAGTYRVAVNTNRYPARGGFFSGGPITRGLITGVQGRFGPIGSAPASTSPAAYFVDIDFTPGAPPVDASAPGPMVRTTAHRPTLTTYARSRPLRTTTREAG